MGDAGGGGGFEADVDEVRAAGGAVIAVADEVEALSRDELMGARGGYGSWVLEGAAERFALRYGNLVETVARELAHAGDVLRDSAAQYRSADLEAPVVHLAQDARDAGFGQGFL